MGTLWHPGIYHQRLLSRLLPLLQLYKILHGKIDEDAKCSSLLAQVLAKVPYCLSLYPLLFRGLLKRCSKVYYYIIRGKLSKWIRNFERKVSFERDREGRKWISHTDRAHFNRIKNLLEPWRDPRNPESLMSSSEYWLKQINKYKVIKTCWK